MPTQKHAAHAYPKDRKERNEWSFERNRLKRVENKHQKLMTLQALLETWEKQPKRDIHYEHDLVKRIREQRVQLTAMRG